MAAQCGRVEHPDRLPPRRPLDGQPAQGLLACGISIKSKDNPLDLLEGHQLRRLGRGLRSIYTIYTGADLHDLRFYSQICS